MKKSIAIILTMILVVCSVIPVSALSTDETQLNSIQLGAKRFSGRLLNRSDIEIAEIILEDLGMNEKQIKNLPEEKMSEIADARSIKKTTEYGKVNANNEQIMLTKSSYDLAVKQYEESKSASESIQPYYQGDGWAYQGDDSLFIKELFVYETKNAPRGTYGLFLGYQWKNFYGHYKGEDVISIAGEHLGMNHSSLLFTLSYTQKITQNGVRSSDECFESYDFNSLTNAKDLTASANCVAVQYNLPNNIYMTTGSVEYSDFIIGLVASAEIDNPQLITRFNIFGNYFHQSFGFGSLGISVNVNGVSVSVSPKAIYSQYQITTSSPIEYIPY